MYLFYDKNQVRPGIRPSQKIYIFLFFYDNTVIGENTVFEENIVGGENKILVKTWFLVNIWFLVKTWILLNNGFGEFFCVDKTYFFCLKYLFLFKT